MYHVGVLAPSLDGAAELLRRFGSADSESRPVDRPEVTVNWAPLASGAEPWQRADPDYVRGQLALSVARLREAGAHFFVCPDDTAYVALEDAGSRLSLPGVHVAGAVADEAQRRGYARVGILGTRWTLSRDRYDQDLALLGSAALGLPLAAQTTLHSIVFDELARGRASLQSRDTVLAMVDWMGDQGCQAVVLGSSLLGQLVTPSSASLPLLDTSRVLADAALAVAAGRAQLPQWHGGPLVLTR